MAYVLAEPNALPVPVLGLPHWRVHYQPNRYIEDRISSLGECVELIERSKVALRGWDFPHLSGDEQRYYGHNYLASWASFLGSVEYWRFYMSGQFLHLNAVEEVLHPNWRSELEKAGEFHLNPMKKDWASVPGYFSFYNFFYTVVEVFEFATRLCLAGVYQDALTISIHLKHVKKFVLMMTDTNREWSGYRALDEDDFGNSWTIAAADLIAESAEHSLKAATWFFERFHWLNPPIEHLRREQRHFLQGVV